MQFTEEELSRMSFKERENALELMELEAQMAASAEPSAEASPAPEPEVNPDPATTPETAQVPAQTESETPELSQETIEYWKQEAEKWKKRKADADRALTPAQQKAASAKKELKSKEDEWKTIAISLQEKLDALEKRLEQAPVNKPVPETALLSPEFEETYEDIAKEMKRFAGTMSAQMQRDFENRIKAVEERNRILEERNRAFEVEQLKVQDATYAAQHYAQLKALHPDIDDYIDPNKKGTQIFEWASKKPVYIQDVIHNPLNYTPLDVSDVLARFKAENGVTTKKPSLGDVMVRANSLPQIPEPQAEQYLSDYELKNFDSIMRANRHDPEKMADLVRKYEATLTRNN